MHPVYFWFMNRLLIYKVFLKVLLYVLNNAFVFTQNMIFFPQTVVTKLIVFIIIFPYHCIFLIFRDSVRLDIRNVLNY